MSVHYKFKSAKDFSTINFDGSYISVGDLKRAIVEQKKLGKSIENFDLQITNAQTNEGTPVERFCLVFYIFFYTKIDKLNPQITRTTARWCPRTPR